MFWKTASASFIFSPYNNFIPVSTFLILSVFHFCSLCDKSEVAFDVFSVSTHTCRSSQKHYLNTNYYVPHVAYAGDTAAVTFRAAAVLTPHTVHLTVDRQLLTIYIPSPSNPSRCPLLLHRQFPNPLYASNIALVLTTKK